MTSKNDIGKVKELAEKLNEEMHCPYCHQSMDYSIHSQECPLKALLNELEKIE